MTGHQFFLGNFTFSSRGLGDLDAAGPEYFGVCSTSDGLVSPAVHRFPQDPLLDSDFRPLAHTAWWAVDARPASCRSACPPTPLRSRCRVRPRLVSCSPRYSCLEPTNVGRDDGDPCGQQPGRLFHRPTLSSSSLAAPYPSLFRKAYRPRAARGAGRQRHVLRSSECHFFQNAFSPAADISAATSSGKVIAACWALTTALSALT
jgi:hypothetical protein